MTENEVTNTSTAGAIIEPEKVPKEEETEAPQTSTSQDINDDPIEDIEDIEEGVLEKHSPSLPLLKWNSRYFSFGTSESKVSHENLRQYYKKIRKTIKVPSESRESPVEDKATTSAATEVAGEVIQAKSDDHNPLLHCLSTNIAHATQTGKGLLFYYKSKDHSKEPLGVINLKFVKEVKESSSGGKVYEFKIIAEDREYLLRADSESTRKRWINTITTRAKESKEFPVPETEEYQNIYNQVYHDRFLKDSGVTSDSEGCTSGEDNEIKQNRRKTFGFFSKPEKVKKAEKTETTTTTTTTTTTEVTETVEEEGSDPVAVVTATTVNTTSETTEEVKTGENKPGLFHYFSFGKKTEKEKVEVKESTEEVVEAENSNAVETKVEEVEKTTEEDSKVSQKRKNSMIPSFWKKSKETTTVATASSTNTETVAVAVEKTEETVETTVEKTETSPTTSPKSIFSKFWGGGKKDDSHVEAKVVETVEQTEVTDTVVEETAQTVPKATEEVVEEVAVKTTTEEVVEDVKSEGSSTKKLIRKITKVFKKDAEATKEVKEVKIEETEEVAETTEEITETTAKVEEEGVAGSSTEVKKEETVEVKKEEEKKEIIEEKKEKNSFFKRLSKQTQPLQPEEVKPETQPTTEDAIKSATEATDNESECVVLKKIKDPRHHGPLNKVTKRIMGEKSEPRYFVFTQEGSLTYYKSEKDESEPKKIEINHDVTITKTGDNVFQIETKSKIYKLSATSEEKRDEWVNLLEEYKKSLPVTSPDEQSSSSKVQNDAEKTEEITEEKAKEITEGETEKTKEITEVIIEEKTKEITEVITEEKTEEITEEITEVKVEEKIEEKIEEETVVKVEEKIEEQTEVKIEGESVEKKTEEETIVETSTTVDETK